MRNRLSIVLGIVFAIIAIAATCYGLVVLTDAVVKMAVAVIAGTAGIMAAILTHTFQQMREHEMERLHRMRELEMERLHQKEKNYALIIERLGEYLREPEAKGDYFTSAHLLTWVVGSPEVVKLTLEFMTARNPETLKRLLIQMRSDLNLPTDMLMDVTTQKLFPIPPSPKLPGGFGNQ
jgi:hypothetical protein